MKQWSFFFLLFVIQIDSFGVTIVRNGNEGAYFMVLSGKQVVVIDNGSASQFQGLLSYLRDNNLQYNRIVLSHVQTDDTGIYMAAHHFLKMNNHTIQTKLPVSQTDERDLYLIVKASNLKRLLEDRPDQMIVLPDTVAQNHIIIDTPHLTLEEITISPSDPSPKNPPGLLIKISEIRDGDKRAFLFTGNIDKNIQKKLLMSPKADIAFADVYAVTIPHPDDSEKLRLDFIKKVRRFTDSYTVLLHTAHSSLDSIIAYQAAEAGLSVQSLFNEAVDVQYINLFDDEKTFHLVDVDGIKLADIVQNELSDFMNDNAFTAMETSTAVGKYCQYLPDELITKGTVISWPSAVWIKNEVKRTRAQFNIEVERLIKQLQTSTLSQSIKAQNKLEAILSKLNQEQTNKYKTVLVEVEQKRRDAFDLETEALILQLQSPNITESVKAEKELTKRRDQLSKDQKIKSDVLLKQIKRKRAMEKVK
ncbi:MAG: hypothetical protein JEZ14_21945 [Marinilabiliaceae bacterium]|nr:hypothetical protein [Marinilabiliaceae bacterium]